jgi:ribosome biogenesis GTPase / thiamine phosphate phosphatase
MNSILPASLQLEDYGWSAHFRRAEADLNLIDPLRVRVMAVHRDTLDVASPAFSGRIPPTLDAAGEDRPTVGDWLAINSATHRILAIYPRFSLFKRRGAGSAARIQLIAANVDTVLIVTSTNQDFNIARLERYLAIAHEAQVTPVIVVTKADLVDDPQDYVRQAMAVQRGVIVEAMDARDASALRPLSPWFGVGQTIALMGSSGVGKSTIVDSLLEHAVQDTSGIREDDSRGRHTTTGRSLHRISTGAWLIDTPGMRELQIVDASDGIAQVFEDVAALISQCRFSDCTHQTEPGCAVQAALETGTLDMARFKRFQKLQREERFNSEQVHEAHARARKFGKMAKQAMRDKQQREW